MSPPTALSPKINCKRRKSRAALKTTDKASLKPTSVQEIVAARIDTLESTVSLVLKVRPALGVDYPYSARFSSVCTHVQNT